jgi:hypothetical protein
MTLVIILFGALTFLAGIVILINPEIIFGYLYKNIEKPILHILAVAIRLVLGLFMILESNVSRFPQIIEVIGWISIIAAIVLGIIGKRYFNSLMKWALSLSEPLGRIGGIFAIGFGAFLVYSFIN